MAYQIAATAVTLNDVEGHSPVAGLFRCNMSNIYAAFYRISMGYPAMKTVLTQYGGVTDVQTLRQTEML